MEKDEITKNFFQNQKAGITFRMYKVMILPLAEQDMPIGQNVSVNKKRFENGWILKPFLVLEINRDFLVVSGV